MSLQLYFADNQEGRNRDEGVRGIAGPHRVQHPPHLSSLATSVRVSEALRGAQDRPVSSLTPPGSGEASPLVVDSMTSMSSYATAETSHDVFVLAPAPLEPEEPEVAPEAAPEAAMASDKSGDATAAKAEEVVQSNGVQEVKGSYIFYMLYLPLITYTRRYSGLLNFTLNSAALIKTEIVFISS